ncbi:MAG TPA: lysophospholipid transporter LplT [Burkholderiales bacterium]|nr:lysophospholipid transporter LplT [Burkholderiales bacterium]
MKLGFYIILAAQFFSALADNALLFAAIALLMQMDAPSWQQPVLNQFFVFSYIALAPFVGPFADSLPKGTVMFISNAVKSAGCLAMLIGMHPFYAYGIVGIGAAMYSPAKYGILTEYLPPQKLVLANGWMEGLTVAAIILGAILGSFLVNPQIANHYLELFDIPGIETGINTPPEFAISVVLGLYVIAASFNLYIPRVAIDHKLPKKNPLYILQDFWHCFRLLWRDPLGQVSLAVTTLFWGVGVALRLMILAWAAVALKFSLEKATQLTAVAAIGIAIGAIIAAKYVKLEKSVRILPVGIAMGIGLMATTYVTNLYLALAILLFIGAMAGFFVVPMNALLQHRGHLLMGAGHSIAVQNFNENLSILAMLGVYAVLDKLGFSIFTVMIIFGLFSCGAMAYLYRRHAQDKIET